MNKFLDIDSDLLGFLNEILSNSNVDTLDAQNSIFDAAERLSQNIEKISESIDDELGEKLSADISAATEELEFVDFWKYAIIFNAIENELYQIELPYDESIRQKFIETANSSIEVLDIINGDLDEIGLSENSNESDVFETINLLIGCLYIGLEMAIGYNDEEGEWVSVGDIDVIKQWACGFGNPYEYPDNPVSEAILTALDSEAPGLKDEFYEGLHGFFKYAYQIDIEEFSSDDGPDWDAISEQFEELL